MVFEFRFSVIAGADERARAPGSGSNRAILFQGQKNLSQFSRGNNQA
jgi:hypothetical protein